MSESERIAMFVLLSLQCNGIGGWWSAIWMCAKELSTAGARGFWHTFRTRKKECAEAALSEAHRAKTTGSQQAIDKQPS